MSVYDRDDNGCCICTTHLHQERRHNLRLGMPCQKALTKLRSLNFPRVMLSASRTITYGFPTKVHRGSITQDQRRDNPMLVDLPSMRTQLLLLPTVKQGRLVSIQHLRLHTSRQTRSAVVNQGLEAGHLSLRLDRVCRIHESRPRWCSAAAVSVCRVTLLTFSCLLGQQICC